MGDIYQLTRPAKARLTVYQGSTFQHKFLFKLGDDPFPFLEGFGLSDWSARMHVRQALESETCALNLTTENGRLDLFATPTESGWLIKISAEDTEALVAGEYVYDLELVRASDDFVLRVQEGVVRVIPEVTRGECEVVNE